MSSNPTESRRIIEANVRNTHKTMSARPSDAKATAVLAAVLPLMDSKPTEWFDRIWDEHKGAGGRQAWIALVTEAGELHGTKSQERCAKDDLFSSAICVQAVEDHFDALGPTRTEEKRQVVDWLLNRPAMEIGPYSCRHDLVDGLLKLYAEKAQA